MPIKTITHADLGKINNGAGAPAIDGALQFAVSDFVDRGEEDEKPRVVTIKVTMQYVKGRPVVDIQAHPSIPAFRTGTMEVAARGSKRDARLLFRDDSDDFDQPTFRDHGLNDSGNDNQ